MKRALLNSTNIMTVSPVASVRANLSGTLTVLSGSALGTAFPLPSTPVNIGRSPDNELQLDDDGISRCHARVTPTRGTYMLEDLGSTNGTFVDGVRVTHAFELVEGARIQLGATVLQFDLQDRLQQEASRRMYDMAVRDGLTGLYNRRHFNERLTAEFAFAERHATWLGIMLIDVDHFKQVNDRWGHPAGDAALQEVGRTLQTSVRTEDLVARFGGEEFAVLVRGIAQDGVCALAERLRALVQSRAIELPSGSLRITASIGVAHNNDADVKRSDQLVAAADAALYEAKRRGRNRVQAPLPASSWLEQEPPGRRAALRHPTTKLKGV